MASIPRDLSFNLIKRAADDRTHRPTEKRLLPWRSRQEAGSAHTPCPSVSSTATMVATAEPNHSETSIIETQSHSTTRDPREGIVKARVEGSEVNKTPPLPSPSRSKKTTQRSFWCARDARKFSRPGTKFPCNLGNRKNLPTWQARRIDPLESLETWFIASPCNVIRWYSRRQEPSVTGIPCNQATDTPSCQDEHFANEPIHQ